MSKKVDPLQNTHVPIVPRTHVAVNLDFKFIFLNKKLKKDYLFYYCEIEGKKMRRVHETHR